MEIQNSFIQLVEESIRKNWNLDALTDYKGATLQYRDVARKIEKMHILFEHAGIKKGDKIALCGRNSANWTAAFLGIVTYGAVAVPILHEFKADNVHHIVNHSEARMLFVGDQVWENFNERAMPNLEGIIELKNYDLVVSRSKKLTYAREHLNEEFGKKYPCRFRAEQVAYRREDPEELAVINYTSGTTGYSKGVMLPYRSIISNIVHIDSKVGLKPGDRIVSMLPLGHIFGLVFDFLYGITVGAHLWFLTRMPSPKIIAESFAVIRPRVIACVPLIVEKIFKKNILPQVDSKLGKLLLHIPIVSDKIKDQIRKQAMEVFGGNFIEIVIGGAPFNAEVEAFLRKINFPYTIAYGMTECAPLICHSRWDEILYMSCGKTVSNMETKVDSPDPENIPGELLCRGMNVMLGYYKNQEATGQTIDKDGWLHTGDMAVKDADGNIFIKGRCKNMLLTASGQNIYPEEIEARLNNMPFVNESLVILKDNKLVALVYPDNEEAFAQNLTKKQLEDAIEQNRVELNKLLPAYSQVAHVKLYPEEFEKTAKKSIKRFLYQ
ncbi:MULTISPECIES: AMP-binding protein [Bacteroides]|uniref:AMP-binding protein n=1 Tax=Bacteroides gallinaceum TaxID=1462571 RepID=A0ABT7VDV8_9BACE|nr:MULTISPECIES: AMP-binding protein [Bacteroides]MCR8917571.1 AMP-binding protein [Bacteroides sp. ET225]MDM8208612.1 AMP-binding protein [Bacteroides gallinaceum]MDM8324345.1 AMP-binding protein [Bacteroides gallinaceum]